LNKAYIDAMHALKAQGSGSTPGQGFLSPLQSLDDKTNPDTPSKSTLKPLLDHVGLLSPPATSPGIKSTDTPQASIGEAIGDIDMSVRDSHLNADAFIALSSSSESNKSDSDNEPPDEETTKGLERPVHQEQPTSQKQQFRLGNRYIYLIKPRTTSSHHVLIPLKASITLGEALRHREVLEFPTLQVLSHPPNKVPDSFILEVEYLAQFQIQQQEIEHLASLADDILADGQKAFVTTPETGTRTISNNDDILAILQRDIMGA